MVQGTLLYFFVYIMLLQFQSFSKFYLIAQRKKAFAQAKKDGEPLPPKQKNFALKVKYYNTDDLMALMGDRSVGNFVEQAVLFLPLYWMHAIFVDPTVSWTIAMIYSASRALYPIAFQMHFSGLTGAVGLSTGPGYVVIGYMWYQLATKYVFA